MRRIVATAAVLLAVACGARADPPAPSSPIAGVSPSATRATTTVSPTPPSSPTTVPVLPSGVPASYGQNVAAGDVPLPALIPKGAVVDGSWYATLPSGEAIVVAYEEPSTDPFRAARGLVLWRRFSAAPYWRATFGSAHGADEGVLSIGALIADVTGDGAPDALVMASTGGSGACGIWSVVDLTASAQVWRAPLCDAQVVPSTAPVGLTLTEAVFKQADAHCCPSATRTTILVYAGSSRWKVASKTVTPVG